MAQLIDIGLLERPWADIKLIEEGFWGKIPSGRYLLAIIDSVLAGGAAEQLEGGVASGI